MFAKKPRAGSAEPQLGRTVDAELGLGVPGIQQFATQPSQMKEERTFDILHLNIVLVSHTIPPCAE